MSTRFNRLNVPDQWEHYWSRYPQGYTIMEALLNWVNQVDNMVENVNDWNEYLENFVETFDEQLAPTVRDMLNEMEADGRLADIINETIFADLNQKIDSVAYSIYPTNTPAEIIDILNSELYNTIIFKEGTYNITTVDVVLQGDRHWVFDGEVNFFYGSTVTNSDMFTINANGHSFSTSGDMFIDGNNHAKEGLTIRNTATSMDNAPTLKIDKLRGENFYSRTLGQSASGLLILGAFETVEIDNVIVKQVSRLQGVGTPGSQGCSGVTITHSSETSYVKNILINNILAEDITNQEIHDTEYDVDCDGLAVLAPLTNGVAVESTTVIKNSTFKDCKGRSIKCQRTNPKIGNITIYRGKEQSIANGTEIDCQRGAGTINNMECHYQETPEGGTPFGISFALIKMSTNSQAVGQHGLINNLTIKNNVSPSNPIPYLFILIASTTKMDLFTVSNFHHSGSGRIRFLIHGDLSNVNMIVLQNSYISWLLTLINNTGLVKTNVKLLNVTEGNPSQETVLVRGVVDIQSTNVIGFNDNYSIMDKMKHQFLENSRTATFYNSNGNAGEALQVHDYLNQDRVFGVRGSGLLSGKAHMTADYFNYFFVPWSIKDTAGAPTSIPLKQDGTEAIAVSVYNEVEEKLYLHVGGGVWKALTLA